MNPQLIRGQATDTRNIPVDKALAVASENIEFILHEICNYRENDYFCIRFQI